MELITGLTALQQDIVIDTEDREGWPLLSVETEVNGDSKSTNERGPSLVGSLGFSCRYKRFLSCLGSSRRPSTRYFFFLTVHYFNAFVPRELLKWRAGHCRPFVTEVMTDGCVHLVYVYIRFNRSWKFPQLAAGQLLSGQGRRYSVRPIHHSTNKTCLVTAPQLSKAGRRAGTTFHNNVSSLCVPIAQQAGQVVVLGCLPLSLCLWS
jgi:hypothetical protein